jgi:hypothetical protein
MLVSFVIRSHRNTLKKSLTSYFYAVYNLASTSLKEIKMNKEDIFDADGTALQAALDVLEVIVKTDPGTYDEIIAPVAGLLRQRLSSSWRGV